MTARFLTETLKILDAPWLHEIGNRLGIPGPIVIRVANGARGQALRADYHVRLCGYLGIDPISGFLSADGRARLTFHAPSFALAFKMRRFYSLHTITETARLSHVSRTVISRIEAGNPGSWETVLRACAYAMLNPRDYIVSRETTGNVLKSLEVA